MVRTKAKIGGHATKFIHKSGNESYSVTLKVGNLVMDEDDINTLVRLVKILKENPKFTCDFNKPHDDGRWTDYDGKVIP